MSNCYYIFNITKYYRTKKVILDMESDIWPYYAKEIVCYSPGQVAQVVRALSSYAKAVGFIPGQGTHKNPSMTM